MPTKNFTEKQVVELLDAHTYEQVSALTGWSRGRIYNAALAAGARKTEARILERAAERRRRQEETLRALIGSTTTADVLDFLDTLPDESVACHVTSPPYNIGKSYGGGRSDSLAFVYYHGWLMQVVSQMARSTRDGGIVAINVGKTLDWTDNLMPLDVLIFEDLRRAGLTFQSRIVWTIPHGLTPKQRLAERHETILVFSKGQHPTFNPNAARSQQLHPGKRAYKGPRKGDLSGHPFGAFPTDVWSDIPTVRHNHPERRQGAHPAQFPVALAKRLIMLYTMAGDLVCDPFCGSGSSAVAAVESGRNFVGADLFYQTLRDERIANARPDLVTPLAGISDEAVAVWQAEARRVDKVAQPLTIDQEHALCQDIFGDVQTAA